MPGILGACISAIFASVATSEQYLESYKNVIKHDNQAAFQIYSLLVSLAIALVSGGLTGLVMSLSVFDRMRADELFEDEVFWECEADDGKVECEKNELQTMTTWKDQTY